LNGEECNRKGNGRSDEKKPYLRGSERKSEFDDFNRMGIARKKENSAAISREQPSSMAARMVEPDLDVPGMMERH